MTDHPLGDGRHIAGVVDNDVCDKRTYGSYRRAKEASRVHRHAFRMRMRIYKCPHCGWWHLSSETDGYMGKRR